MTANHQTDAAEITRTSGVVGGEARIRNTRIAVWMVVRARQLGLSDAEIVTHYHPLLAADDLPHAWAYHDTHKAEIEDAIRRNEGD